MVEYFRSKIYAMSITPTYFFIPNTYFHPLLISFHKQGVRWAYIYASYYVHEGL